jgi:two-component system NarL family sensor kinase
MRDSAQASEILREIAQALNESLDVGAALDRVLALLVSLLQLRSAWVFSYHEGKRSFQWIGATGLPPALACDGCRELRTGWCECQERFDAKQMDRAINIVRCSRLERSSGDKQGLVFHASVPLRGERSALGILNVAAAGRELFDESTLRLLSAVGHQLAMALERQAAATRLKESSERLRSLLPVGHQLLQVSDERAICDIVTDTAVHKFGYPAAAVMENGVEGRMVAVSVADNPFDVKPYSYWPDEEVEEARARASGRILPDAGSSLRVAIGETGLTLCVESPEVGAFDEWDAQMLAALSMSASAAFDALALRRRTAEAATWRERRQLAADLHDALNQRLFSGALLTQTALSAMSSNTGRAREAMVRVATLIAEAQGEMRDVVNALRDTGTKPTLGLYLREQAERLTLLGYVKARVRLESDPEISGERRDELCRIVDEALQNAIRHGQPRHVWMSLECQGGRLNLTVADDGQGFDVACVSAGIGLESMRERAARIGGELTIRSEPGRGTTVTIVCPLSGSGGGTSS